MDSATLARLLPLVLIVALFWFLVMRPARNRQRQTLAMQSSLSQGAAVMLTSGVFGEVAELGEESVRLRVAPDVTLTVHRNAVGRILSDDDAARMRRGELGSGDPSSVEPAD